MRFSVWRVRCPAQVLANRPDIVREDYMNELCVLQDDVPPFPDEQASCLVVAGLCCCRMRRCWHERCYVRSFALLKALIFACPSPAAGLCHHRGVSGPSAGRGVLLHFGAARGSGLAGTGERSAGQCPSRKLPPPSLRSWQCSRQAGCTTLSMLALAFCFTSNCRRVPLCALPPQLYKAVLLLPPFNEHRPSSLVSLNSWHTVHTHRCTRRCCGRRGRTWRSRCVVEAVGACNGRPECFHVLALLKWRWLPLFCAS